MKNTNKKGFTLVELLVVIAILAILATVAIVGYTSFTNKAHESNDRSLVAQLNIATERATGKYVTMHEVATLLEEHGFDVSLIKATAKDHAILWDMAAQEFFYVEDGDRVGVNSWIVSDTVSSKYSTYYIGADDATINATLGFDAGKATGLTVNYTSTVAQSVVLRLNGGELNVNDTLDASEQLFYGVADGAEVSTGNSCFKAYGVVLALDLKAGKAIAEENAVVFVEAAAEGTELADSKTGAIIIAPTATTEEIKTDKLPEGYVVTETGTTQPANVVEKLGSAMFAGGKGTETDPYLIETAEQFQNISKNNATFYNYKVKDGVKVIDCSNWTPVYLNGNFDGNGVILDNLDKTLFYHFSNTNYEIIDEVTVKNFTVNADIKSDSWNAIVVRTAAADVVNFENIVVGGTISGSIGVASFVCFGAGNYVDSSVYDQTINFVNCSSSATIIATSGNACGFISHMMSKTNAAQVNLTNSKYTGAMQTTSPKYICGNWINATINSDGTNAEMYNTSTNGWKYLGVVTSAPIYEGTLPTLGNVFTLDADENAVTAIVSLVVSPNPGNMTTTYLTEEVEVVDGKITTETIKHFTVRINPTGATATGINGNYYDVVKESLGTEIGSDTIVRITQYDASGNITSITNYDFNDK